MRRKVLSIASFSLFFPFSLAAQEASDLAQKRLVEVSVDKFENAGFWHGDMSADEGFLFLRGAEGAPKERQPLPGEEDAGLEEKNEKVLGAKVIFNKRSVASFQVSPIRPIPIEGVVKTISFWAVGRNTNHRVSLLLKTSEGQPVVVDAGKLNFMGWQKITVTIPPHIRQRDYHRGRGVGLNVTGFRIDCFLDETYGKFYIYFDDLTALTDMVFEDFVDEDDMVDSW